MEETPPDQGGASVRPDGDALEPTTAPSSSQEREPFRVVIEPDPFGYGFDVTVLPPPDGIGHDREFRDHGPAREYADALARITDWPLIDRASG